VTPKKIIIGTIGEGMSRKVDARSKKNRCNLDKYLTAIDPNLQE